jgi:beta-glucoside operon transcriptional antiterminator
MRVQKAINNNIISCVDDVGREVIAMGRGLGYNAKPGTQLKPEHAEKIFRMETQTQTDQFKDLIANLPPEQIELCTRIIAYATETLNRRLSPSVYLTLTDHVSFAIERMRRGTTFRNALLTEVRVFYPQEFAVGKHALDLIEKEQNIRFPEDEAASIALHLVNAEYETSLSATMHITQAIQGILNIVDACPALPLEKDTLRYDELIVHLKFLVMRTFGDQTPAEHEPAFVRMVSESYAEEYRCAQEAGAYLAQQCGHAVAEEEIANMALYFHRACRCSRGTA